MGFRLLERDDNDVRFAFGCFDDVVSMKSLIYVWKSTTCGILFPRTNNPFRPRCFRTDGLRLFHLLIRRRDMSIFMLRRVLRRGPIQRENRSESKMLYNRELTQHIAAPARDSFHRIDPISSTSHFVATFLPIEYTRSPRNKDIQERILSSAYDL